MSRLTILNAQVLMDKDLTLTDLRVYGAICMFANTHSSICFPKQQTIAGRLGINVPMVSKSVGVLVEKGYILKGAKVGADGRKKQNYYTIKYDIILPENELMPEHNSGVDELMPPHNHELMPPHNSLHINSFNLITPLTKKNKIKKDGFSSKEIPTISILENIEPTVKESLTVQSVEAGKCKKTKDFSGQNGVNIDGHTPEFETFWQRYKDLCKKNIETKKNSASEGSKRDAFSEWNKVLKQKISPDKILTMIDVYAKYNLEEFAPPKHACRWFSKTIDWEDYENQIAFFQKQLSALKQAKQKPINSFNKQPQAPVTIKAVVTPEQQNEATEMEAKRKERHAQMKPNEIECLEGLKPVLKNNFGDNYKSTIEGLVLGIKGNEYTFLTNMNVFGRGDKKEKLINVVKRELQNEKINVEIKSI